MKNKTAPIILLILAGLAAGAILLFFWIDPFSKKDLFPDSGSRSGQVFPESFTIFNIGANSRLNAQTMGELEKAFGKPAVTRHTTIDMGIHQKGLVDREFKELSRLNERLNGTSNARVEHNTIMLTFRYPPQKNRFFQYMKFWFSGVNHKPLMVEILTRPDSHAVFKDITEQYGPPEILKLPSEKESLVYWIRENDTLIVSRTVDRFNSGIYHIKIYYVNNLESLHLSELETGAGPVKTEQKQEKSIFN